jgi:hypothetical protein
MKFVLVAAHTGHTFFPFRADTWEQADQVAQSKGWVVDDHTINVDDDNVIVVVPRSLARLAPVVPIR